MLPPPAMTTPSPWWPTWSMAKRSVSATARAHEEFDIAVAARYRRGKHLDIGAAERRGEGLDVVADILLHHRVADDAVLGVFPIRLELWLDQRQQMHRRGRLRQRHRQHRLQGNEADVDDHDIGPRRQPLALEI